MAGKQVVITCSTGIACSNFAIELNAQTAHSFFGIKDGRGNSDVLLKLVESNADAMRRWKEIEIVIIDEVSMISPQLLEALEYIGRRVRENSVIFGGVQIIVSGDFHQLPPVMSDTADNRVYAFESSIWFELFPHSIRLFEVIRQKDMEFVHFLNNIRSGIIGDREREFVRKHFLGKEFASDNNTTTHIFSTNDEVNFFNFICLETLDGEMFVSKAVDEGDPKKIKRYANMNNEREVITVDLFAIHPAEKYVICCSEIFTEEHILLQLNIFPAFRNRSYNFARVKSKPEYPHLNFRVLIPLLSEKGFPIPPI